MGRRQPPRPRRHTVTRYQLPDGTRCAKDTPGAVKIKALTDTYYVKLPREGLPPERISLETANEQEAWDKLRALLLARERAAAGLDAPAVRHASRPIGEHLADWKTHLQDAGNTGAKQVGLLMSRMGELVGLAGWERLGQIDRASALRALSKLTATRGRGVALGHEGRSARTRNHYLRHLKQFTRWCVEDGRLERDPAALVAPVDVESARRHVRRAPSARDVGRLMSYLEGTYCPAEGEPPLAPPVRNGVLTGPLRALGYRVCMATGFRGKELRLLGRRSFDLDAGTVRGLAAHTKSRKEAVLPLPPWLIEELRQHFDAGGGCWERWDKCWPGRLLKADLEACGIPYETDEGVFDFHALRVFFCTFCASSPDISPKTLQALARHSDPGLTLRIYAKAQEQQMRDVVDRMPRPGAG